LFLEIDSWMQAPLSGCVISIQFCPWYRKLVLKVNLA
jgi:epoxyqueuosine reductase QueG